MEYDSILRKISSYNAFSVIFYIFEFIQFIPSLIPKLWGSVCLLSVTLLADQWMTASYNWMLYCETVRRWLPVCLNFLIWNKCIWRCHSLEIKCLFCMFYVFSCLLFATFLTYELLLIKRKSVYNCVMLGMCW